MPDNFQIITILMFAAVILVGIAQKIRIPYPLILLAGGAAIGFFPNQNIVFDPNLILVIVLPPILYYAAFEISFREFKSHWKEIISLALGLVLLTTLVVGLIFKWLFPELPWALAFAFGAIISPPDAVAATTILKRFSISTRLLTILEGESLINDASALVLYKLAIVALLSGSFSLFEGGFEFVKTVSGGILVGIVLGYLFQRFSRHYLEPVVGVIFSFTIPYITYIIANTLEVSGVLAVVVNGLIGSQILLRHHSSLRRILGYAAWDIFIILMNCFVFILIGLQLRTLTSFMTLKQMIIYSGYACLITFAMIAIRLLWVYSKNSLDYFKALHRSHAATRCPEILRESAIIGWSGMRGIVSLTAALALPYAHQNGLLIEGRNEVVFLTFIVILLTLLLPGLTLPLLICRLNIQDQSNHYNTLKIRKQLKEVAEKTIQQMLVSKEISDQDSHFLKEYFTLQVRVLEVTTSPHSKLQRLETARSVVIQEQRKELFKIWEKLEIDDKILSQLEHELDLEETHFARAKLK